jgi:hypothetical protein
MLSFEKAHILDTKNKGSSFFQKILVQDSVSLNEFGIMSINQKKKHKFYNNMKNPLKLSLLLKSCFTMHHHQDKMSLMPERVR